MAATWTTCSGGCRPWSSTAGPWPPCAWSSDLAWVRDQLRRCLLALCWLAATSAAASDAAVWVALSDAGGAYAEAAATLRDELAQGTGRRYDLRMAPWQELLGASPRPPQLIITLGAAALRGMAENSQRETSLGKVPILATLLPRASYEALAPKSRPPTTAVLLDQPAARYLDLLRLVMPERRRVGLVLGPDSQALAAPLAKAAAARGLQLVTAQILEETEDLYPALRTVLAEADVLLALPDNRVFNAGSLQNILITTYRQRVPVVAFSAAYVKAGATVALHASPAQAAVQAAAAARQILAGRPLPAPQLASEYSISVNDRVARSLGLVADDPATLTEALRRLEAPR